MKWLPPLLFIITLLPLVGQEISDKVVQIEASVDATTPSITLSLLAPSVSVGTPSHQKIWRRLYGSTGWGEEYDTGLLATATSYIDTGVEVGVLYEYRVARLFNTDPYTSFGYITAGIKRPVNYDSKKVLLVVESTAKVGLEALVPSPLAQFKEDLVGDGWEWELIEVNASDTVDSVKSAIAARYTAEPDKVQSIFLIGQVPVPYSGNIRPDGHFDHEGAWPADVFYADFDGVWTDTEVNNTVATGTRNDNVPGDGKLDQSIIPSPLEVSVGRVDLSDMPSSPSTELDLLAQYLERDHDYRFSLNGFASVPRRAFHDGGFITYREEDTFASNAFWNFTPVHGSANISAQDWFAVAPNDPYLFALGAGAGSYTAASGIGNTGQFATTTSKVVFNLLMGSYFGDWDVSDSFLRSPLTGTSDSLGLASMWTGRPHWHMHPFAMGEDLGAVIRLSQNNVGDYVSGPAGGGGVHMALMGDPTLRLFPSAPASGLVATSDVTTPRAVKLDWTASPDEDEGYLVYRAVPVVSTTVSREFKLLTPNPVSGVTYTDVSAVPGNTYDYMVRALKLETTSSGTYVSPSQGVFANGVVVDNSGGNSPEISVMASNGYPITDGSLEAMANTETDFGELALSASPVARTYTVKNDGDALLSLTSVLLVDKTVGGAAHFSVSYTPGGVSVGGSSSFTVNFDPSVVGVHEVYVSVLNDDPDEPNFSYVLRGAGVADLPSLTSSQGAVAEVLLPGNTVTVDVDMANGGLGDMNYTVREKYAFRDSNAVDAPEFSWYDISGTGTLVTGWTDPDNGESPPISLPFTFPFYGENETSLIISTEGFLTFSSWIDLPFNSSLPNYGGASKMIAPLWDDLWVDGSAAVYYENHAEGFIIQFENLRRYEDASERATFQVILKPSGEILYQYQSLSFTSESYTVGIQNEGRNEGVGVAFDEGYVSAGLAVRILPPADWLSFSASSGTVGASSTDGFDLLFDSTGVSAGDYFTCVEVSTNDPANEKFSFEVSMKVLSGYEIWLNSHYGSHDNSGVSADVADGDLDGLANLVEYAVGADPTVGDSSGACPVLNMLAGGNVQFVFRRDTGADDVTIRVQSSVDLLNWSTVAESSLGAGVSNVAAVGVAESALTGSLNEVKVEVTGGLGRQFFRLKVLR